MKDKFPQRAAQLRPGEDPIDGLHVEGVGPRAQADWDVAPPHRVQQLRRRFAGKSSSLGYLMPRRVPLVY